MRDINLLPRKPVYERHLTLLLAVMVFAGLVIGSLQYWLADQQGQLRFSEERETARLESQRTNLLQQKTVSDRTIAYLALKQDIEQLLLPRKNWHKDLTFLIGNLPPETELVSMGVTSTGLLNTELQFYSYPDMLNYLNLIQSEPEYASMKVTELTKPEPVSSGTAPSAAVPSVEPDKPDSESEYLRILLEIQLPMSNAKAGE